MIIGTLPNADQNNLIPVDDGASGVSAEALIKTDSQFSFNINGGSSLVEGVDDPSNLLTVTVGLMERSGTEGPWGFALADCPIAVTWTRGFPVDGFGNYTGLPGTVTEKWFSFGVEIVSARRLNVDVGYTRQGPRYTLRLNGPEYEGHVDFVKGNPLRCVVPSPVGGFPFPLRLVMNVSAIGESGGFIPEVRDIILEGQIGQKFSLSATQKAEWGVDSDHSHFRIYQSGIVPGAPLDIDL